MKYRTDGLGSNGGPIMLSVEWDSRVKKWLRTLQKNFYQAIGTIDWYGFPAAERLSYQAAMRQEWAEMKEGALWGREFEYLWLKSEIRIPEKCAGKRIVMDLNPGGEACIYVNGIEFGTRRAESVTAAHHYILDQTLTGAANPGEVFEIVLEVYAGHRIPLQDGFCEAYPLTEGDRYLEEYGEEEEGKRARLGSSTFGVWKEEIYQTWLDAALLSDLAGFLPENSLRRLAIEKGLKEFSRTVQFDAGGEDSLKRGRELLNPLLAARNGSTVPVIYAHGHAHIDLAWLWPAEETKRKVLRTFAAQVRLMEEYPDYVFLQSQPALYEMVKEYYPDLYRKIKEKIKSGQWIAEGAAYVEPDTNLSGGEALIRQILYGKAFFKTEFGVESELMWLPDVFGYSAALPQILKKCGVNYFATQKLFWAYNGGEQFPYNYFRWQGIDGNRVTAHIHYQYDAETNPSAIGKMWEGRAQKENMNGFLLPFGYGDGGGGATRDHLEMAERQSDLEGAAKVRLCSPIRYFKEQPDPVETYVGELYYNCHRGTLTSQSKVKNDNRRCEFALREAELWSGIGGLEQKAEVPCERLKTLWKTLLFHQFHDILPGSSIARVYQDAAKEYGTIHSETNQMIRDCTSAWTDGADGLTVFNSLSFERKVYLSIPESWEAAEDREGNRIPIGRGIMGKLVCVTAPPCGFSSLCPAPGKKGNEDKTKNEGQTQAVLSLRDGRIILENKEVRAEFNSCGELLVFMEKKNGRNVVKGRGNVMELYEDMPHMCDAWDLDSVYESVPVPTEETAEVTILCEKGLEVGFLVKRKIGSSRYEQTISLSGEGRQIDFHMKIDWREHHRLLKSAFSVIYEPMDAVHEIQFGYLKRPAHRSKQSDRDKFEVCNHKWTALLNNSGGAAVLNQAKYGVSTLGNTVKLSLLRAPLSPDPTCDQGEQEICYAFYIWTGGLPESGVVEQGYAYNAPLTVQTGTAPVKSFFRTDAADIFLEAWKKAEDGEGYIIRLYEAYEMHSNCQVSFPWKGIRAWETDMLERRQNELKIAEEEGGCSIPLEFTPFEIKTIRIERGQSLK